MSFEMKLSNGVATITHEYKTKAHCYRAFMVEHLMRNNKVFETCEQEDLQDAFQELILTNRTKIRVPRHKDADLYMLKPVLYNIEITDLDESAQKWGHDFTFYFSFSGMGEHWSEEISPADFRFKLLQSIGNCDGEDLMERIEIASSYEETF